MDTHIQTVEHTAMCTTIERDTEFISRCLALLYIHNEMAMVHTGYRYACEKVTHFPFMFTNLYINLLYITWPFWCITHRYNAFGGSGVCVCVVHVCVNMCSIYNYKH